MRLVSKAAFIQAATCAIWGVNQQDNIYYRGNFVADWQRIPGKLKGIDASDFGVFGVSSADNIYYRVGTHSDPSSEGTSWQQIPGKLKWISSEMDSIWGVNSQDDIYYATDIKFDADGKISLTWVHEAGKLKERNVAVKKTHAIWGVNSADKIYFKDGPKVNWRKLCGHLKQIDVGELGVFGVNSKSDIFYRVGSKGDGSVGAFWQKVYGKLKWISASKKSIWGVNENDDIFFASDISFDDNGQIKLTWNHVPGKLKQVSNNAFDVPIPLSSGAIWGVNSNDNIFFRANKNAPWHFIPGGLKRIDVGRYGVFGVNNNNDIYYRIGTHANPNSPGSGWQQVNGKLKWIASGDFFVWGVNARDEIYYARVNFDESDRISDDVKWKKLDGRLVDISIYNEENRTAIWGVNNQQQIWFRAGLYEHWQRIWGKLKQIDVGKLGVFGVNSGNAIFYRVGTRENQTSSGSSWQRLPGSLKWISASEEKLWGVNAADNIFVAENISFDNNGQISLTWKHIGGKLKQISVFDL